MQEVRSITDADVAGKRVLVRAVLNVPLQDGKVTDDARLRAILPTLELLHERGAAEIVLFGYVGRPEGRVVEELRVAPVAARLKELTSIPFTMLENTRFDPCEEANDPELAKEYAAKGDIFVNDAFADSHRAYASTVAVAKLLPSYAGLLMQKEIESLASALTPPQGSVAVVGGAKFETKLPLIQKLLEAYGEVLLGGALGNDVIKARGLPFGASLISAEPVPVAVATNERLHAPFDAIVQGAPGAERMTLVSDIRAEERVVDIGPATAESWAHKVAAAPFVLWNGPLGMYEDGFVDGTDALARALKQCGARAVVGGGDTVAALKKVDFDPAKVFVSTGGGAMLEYLTHGTLPGLDALRQGSGQALGD